MFLVKGLQVSVSSYIRGLWKAIELLEGSRNRMINVLDSIGKELGILDMERRSVLVSKLNNRILPYLEINMERMIKELKLLILKLSQSLSEGRVKDIKSRVSDLRGYVQVIEDKGRGLIKEIDRFEEELERQRVKPEYSKMMNLESEKRYYSNVVMEMKNRYKAFVDGEVARILGNEVREVRLKDRRSEIETERFYHELGDRIGEVIRVLDEVSDALQRLKEDVIKDIGGKRDVQGILSGFKLVGEHIFSIKKVVYYIKSGLYSGSDIEYMAKFADWGKEMLRNILKLHSEMERLFGDIGRTVLGMGREVGVEFTKRVGNLEKLILQEVRVAYEDMRWVLEHFNRKSIVIKSKIRRVLCKALKLELEEEVKRIADKLKDELNAVEKIARTNFSEDMKRLVGMLEVAQWNLGEIKKTKAKGREFIGKVLASLRSVEKVMEESKELERLKERNDVGIRYAVREIGMKLQKIKENFRVMEKLLGKLEELESMWRKLLIARSVVRKSDKLKEIFSVVLRVEGKLRKLVELMKTLEEEVVRRGDALSIASVREVRGVVENAFFRIRDVRRSGNIEELHHSLLTLDEMLMKINKLGERRGEIFDVMKSLEEDYERMNELINEYKREKKERYKIVVRPEVYGVGEEDIGVRGVGKDMEDIEDRIIKVVGEFKEYVRRMYPELSKKMGQYISGPTPADRRIYGIHWVRKIIDGMEKMGRILFVEWGRSRDQKFIKFIDKVKELYDELSRREMKILANKEEDRVEEWIF